MGGNGVIPDLSATIPGNPVSQPQSTQPGSPTVSRPQQGGVAGAPLRIAQDIMAIHQATQNNAMAQLDKNLRAREAGFPVDPKAIVKLAKKAGLNFSNKPEDAQATIDLAHGKVPGPTPSGGAQGAQAQPSAGQQATGQAASNVQQVQKGKMTQAQQKQAAAEYWAQNALQAAQQRGESAARLAQLHDQVTSLKLDAVSDDKDKSQRAVGKLMSINEIPFTLDHAEWAGASPEQKNSMINIAAGHETQAQFNSRVASMENSMIADGRFTDPEMAHRAATALANNQPIPADVRATMKQFTMKELTDQATLGNQLIELGVPSSKLQGVMAAASVGGLEYALPTGLNPLIVQQIAQKNQELKIEQERVGVEAAGVDVEKQKVAIEVARYNQDAERMQVAAAREENQEFFNNFRAIAELKKQAGVTIPKDVENAYIAELAQRSGLEVSETKRWYQYVTGGTTLQFTPKAATKAAAAGAGKQTSANNPSNTGSEIQSLYKGYRKVVKKTAQALGVAPPDESN